MTAIKILLVLALIAVVWTLLKDWADNDWGDDE